MPICTAGCNVPLVGAAFCECWTPLFDCNPGGGTCVPEVGCEGTCEPTGMLWATVALVVFVFCVLPCLSCYFCCRQRSAPPAAVLVSASDAHKPLLANREHRITSTR